MSIKKLFIEIFTIFTLILPTTGCVKNLKFETSIYEISNDPPVADVIRIGVNTTTKKSLSTVKEVMVESLQFSTNNSDKYTRCSILYNDYHTNDNSEFSNNEKYSHTEYYVAEPTEVFDITHKSTSKEYATDKSTGKLSIDKIAEIHDLKTHSKDKFIYTDMSFNTTAILNVLAKQLSVEPDTIHTINVAQYNSNVDSTTLSFHITNDNVWTSK